MQYRQLFLQHIAQTSPEPIALEIVKAEGIFQYDASGKKYIDLISGFSVANIGHSHPLVIEAVQKQAAAYMHLIVYGEFIQAPQVSYATLLTEHLPAVLNNIYFTNSGTEATEGAIKLSKRVTGRSKIIACNKSYHGSTQGALSLMGDEYYRNAFRPLLPDVHHYDYNSNQLVDAIDKNTSCVILETVQAESGINKPDTAWLQAIREKCNQYCSLLILDEIQCGFGRTGSLWAFQQFDVVPDILLLGKGLGGGMPLGAFISDKKMMQVFTHDPVLGHITTFGGHPVSCAAGKAALNVLLNENYIQEVKAKERIIQKHFSNSTTYQCKTAGLWASLIFKDHETCKKIVHACIKQGIITDWFLFAPEGLRIAPPLCITGIEMEDACLQLLAVINEFT